MNSRILTTACAILSLAAALMTSSPAETAYTETNTLTVDTRGLWLGNVEIRVVDGTTGNTIPDVLVTAASQNQMTDSGGIARFNNLAAADYTFSVVKSGYVSADVKRTVVAGVWKAYQVPLFAGTSVDMAQIPFAGAQVIEDIAADGSKRTKLLTHYRLNGTAPDYTVSLRYRRGSGGVWTAIAPASLAHYGGNAPDFGAGVKPGTHSVAWDVATDLPNMHEPMLQVEITAIRSGRTALKETSFITVDTGGQTLSTLTGRIINPGATPLVGVTVLLMPHNKSVVTSADGTFSLTGLVPGTGCVLKATAADHIPLVRNNVSVPITSLHLGDLVLTAEARQMLVRPLNPNPNPDTLGIPVGGTGYLYYMVRSADGMNPCPGQTVLLETSAGTLIPQSTIPRDNWAGPIAGVSDKDGIVRLEVPASSIGGVGAGAAVRIRATPTIAPDTANFPAGLGRNVFSTATYVAAREWEQVRTLETSVGGSVGVAAVGGAYLGLERAREITQRSLYAGNMLREESILSGIQVVGKAGVELSSPEVKVKVLGQGSGLGASAGAHGYLGLVNHNEYQFDAVAGAPSGELRDNTFKLYHCLRDDLRDSAPASIGDALIGIMDTQVLPAFSDQLTDSETGVVLGGGASASVEFGFKLLPEDRASVGAEARLDVNAQMEKSWSRSGDGSRSHIWEGIAGGASVQAGAGLDLSFFDAWLPQSDGLKPPGVASARRSVATEVAGRRGCLFDNNGTLDPRTMTLVEELSYVAPGLVDVGAYLDPITFPDLPFPQTNQTRRFVVEYTVKHANGGTNPHLNQLRGVSPWMHSRRKEAMTNFSSDPQYIVTYDRHMETGEASAGSRVGFDLNLGLGLEFEASGRNFRSAGSRVEHGRIWRGREMPQWTSSAPQQTEVPADTMTSVMSGWAGTAASDLTDLLAQAATKTVKTVAGKVVHVWNKVTFQSVPARSSNDGPQYAPPPPASDGWENYGISGLYELTSETPITTPVPLAISYTSEDLGGGNEADLAAYYFIPETAEWQLVPSTLDLATQTVTVDATRTGFYGLALPQPAGTVQLVLDAPAPLPADGTTIATVRATGLVLNNGQLVPDGTLYTITATGVSLTGTDASPALDGFQAAAANGMIAIGIQTPPGGVGAALTAEAAESGTAKGTLEIPLRDTTAPPAPGGLTLTGAGSSLRASWAASSAADVMGYRVYYKRGVAGPPWDGVANIEGDTSPLFTDESFADLRGLTAGDTYYVAVAAVDEAGQESPLSLPASLLLLATPPAAPTAGTVVKGATGAIFLSWILSADDLLGQRNVDHYEVRRRLPGAAWTVIGSAASGQNTFGDTWPAGLDANEYPEYVIVPVSAAGAAGQAAGTVFDSDSDTLPDPWETASNLNPFDPADSTANGDGDLRNNLEEYLAGSFPGVSDGTDFRVTQFSTETSTNGSRLADMGTVRLSWNAEAALATGESYIVEASQTLAPGSWTPVADAQISVVNRTGVAVVTRHADRPREFYRITIAGRSVAASYSSWIGGFYPGATDPALIAATADPDHDGLPNAVEMVLGGNPATVNDSALMPTIALTATDLGEGTEDYFEFTYRRTARALAAGLTCQAQYSLDLSNPWTNAAANVAGVSVMADPDFHGAGIDRVRVYIPRAGRPSLFGRLRVLAP